MAGAAFATFARFEVPFVAAPSCCESCMSCEIIDVPPPAPPVALDGVFESGSDESVPVAIASASNDANSGDCAAVEPPLVPPALLVLLVLLVLLAPLVPDTDPATSCWICMMRACTAATPSRVMPSSSAVGPASFGLGAVVPTTAGDRPAARQWRDPGVGGSLDALLGAYDDPLVLVSFVAVEGDEGRLQPCAVARNHRPVDDARSLGGGREGRRRVAPARVVQEPGDGVGLRSADDPEFQHRPGLVALRERAGDEEWGGQCSPARPVAPASRAPRFP